jgi:hypothetical protein
MVATTMAESTHNGTKPASRPKTTQMPELLILYYFSFSMVADQNQQRWQDNLILLLFSFSIVAKTREPSISQRTTSAKTPPTPQHLILYYLSFSMVATTRTHTMALNQPADQSQQRRHNTLFSITILSLWLQPQEQRTQCNGNTPAARRPKTTIAAAVGLGQTSICTDKKEYKIFLMYCIGKFRWDRVQSHMWGGP